MHLWFLLRFLLLLFAIVVIAAVLYWIRELKTMSVTAFFCAYAMHPYDTNQFANTTNKFSVFIYFF